jgi:hypothetical protein
MAITRSPRPASITVPINPPSASAGLWGPSRRLQCASGLVQQHLCRGLGVCLLRQLGRGGRRGIYSWRFTGKGGFCRPHPTSLPALCDGFWAIPARVVSRAHHARHARPGPSRYTPPVAISSGSRRQDLSLHLSSRYPSGGTPCHIRTRHKAAAPKDHATGSVKFSDSGSEAPHQRLSADDPKETYGGSRLTLALSCDRH